MDLRVLDFPQCDPKRNHRKDEGNKNKERPGVRRNRQRMFGRARGSRESVKGSHRPAAVGAPSGLGGKAAEWRADVSSAEMKKSDQRQDQQYPTRRSSVLFSVFSVTSCSMCSCFTFHESPSPRLSATRSQT